MQNAVTTSSKTLWVCVDNMYAFWSLGDCAESGNSVHDASICDAAVYLDTTGKNSEYGIGDRLIRGMPFLPDGIYRRVDSLFLGWMWASFRRAEKMVPAIDPEKLRQSRDFIAGLIRATKLTPTPVEQVPVSYRKPSDSSPTTCTFWEDGFWGGMK